MRHSIIILSILIVSMMTSSQTQPDMDRLLWIVDSWVSTGGGESTSYEEWTKVNDSYFEGGSKTVKNGVVVFEEKLKIISENGNIYYVAEVAHNPAPVYFKLIQLDSGKAVFENPNHDFPQKITYLLEDGNLHAYIEGPSKKGDWKKVDFYFTKVR